MSGNESEKGESEKIGALWKQKSKQGMEYLGGEVNGERVVVFEVRKKWQKNSPDYQVFKSSRTPTDGDKDKDEAKDKPSDTGKHKDKNKGAPF